MTWKNRKRLAMVRIQLRKTLKYLLHVGFTESSVCKRFLPFAGFFFFLHLWDFSVSSLLKIGSSLLNFLRFELWICSWRILSKAIRRRSYEITSNAPLRPFTIASADDSLEL